MTAFNGVTRVFPQSRVDVQRVAGQSDVVQNLLLDIRDAATPTPLGDAVFSVVGDAQTVIHAPAGTLAWQLRVEVDSFLLRTGDQNERTIGSIVSGSANIIISGHGYDPSHDAEGPVSMKSTDTLPAPLVSGELYFIHSLDADTIRFHSTHDDAHNHVNPVVFTTSGAGTLTIGGTLAAPTETDIAGGDNAITVSAGPSAGPPQSRLEVSGRAASDHTITVKGSGAGARLLYWFIG